MKKRVKSSIYTFLSNMKWWSVASLAVVVGQLRGRRHIVSAWPENQVTLGPQVALFVHYDKRGAVRPQVLHYLRELQKNGRDVVFITNSGRLAPDGEVALREICAAVMVRRNIGYDFGAWADALKYFGLPCANTKEIIFANDSMFGPMLPLSGVLRRLDYNKADIWGLTDSWQICYHLQSFFLAFGPDALRSEQFKKYWNSVRPVPMKSFIIKAYEVGLTQTMIEAGLRCAALWRYEDITALASHDEFKRLLSEEKSSFNELDPIRALRTQQILRIRKNIANREAMNPTADLWRQLLLADFPFIKRELLCDNPADIHDISDWAKVVDETLSADPEPIRQDLRLMLDSKTP
jgi:hypothetical protein